MRYMAVIGALVLANGTATGAVTFTEAPSAARDGDAVRITFAVSAPTDVEVTVLDAEGRAVRHLAAGVLGREHAPPEPLKPGLRQNLEWDGKDDLGTPAQGAFTVRVRAGSGLTFGRLIGGDPCVFGAINSIATDEAGNLYAMAYAGSLNQNMDTLRMFTPDGQYVRTLIPFPADLARDRAGAAATWHENRKSYVLHNQRSQLPVFYPWGAGARLVSVSRKGGIVLTQGTNVYRMDLDGGNIRGPFLMWRKAAKLKNPKWNVPQLAVSPDGRFFYYANVAGTRYDPKGYKDFDAAWPQGRVYRQDTQTDGADPKPFYDLELPDWPQSKYWLPDAWNKRTAAYGLAVDAKGHLYVCDLVNQEVVELDAEGNKVSATKAPWPERIHVDPKTGNYYVVCRLEKPRDGYVAKKLVKIVGRGEGSRIAAEMPLKRWRGLGQASALGAVDGEPVLWLGGGGALICVKDTGEAFEPIETNFKPDPDAQGDFNRIDVDYRRDEVYTSNGANRLWRYDGQTGTREILRKNGREFNGTDLAVGYDGLLYVRTGTSFSGPLARYTRDLDPAPFPSGTHVLSKYIYSRYGVGNCEKGLGVGPRGETYISFMYGWNDYLVCGFGADGLPIKGKYLEGIFKPDTKRGAPASLNAAVVGPVPAASGGVRVDVKGNIYVGARVRPKEFTPPAGFKKDRAYLTWTGSVVKFGPEGGTFLGLKNAQSRQPDAPRVALAGTLVAEGATQVYPGLGPMSGGGYGGGGSVCVCRVPRFDVDPYGRLVMTNAVTNSLIYLDNAGNRIAEVGGYGNFDSQLVNPGTETGRAGSPTVTVPAIPLGWPTGAGMSERRIYVNDTLNRRIVRVDIEYAAEATCPVK